MEGMGERGGSVENTKLLSDESRCQIVIVHAFFCLSNAGLCLAEARRHCGHRRDEKTRRSAHLSHFSWRRQIND